MHDAFRRRAVLFFLEILYTYRFAPATLHMRTCDSYSEMENPMNRSRRFTLIRTISVLIFLATSLAASGFAQEAKKQDAVQKPDAASKQAAPDKKKVDKKGSDKKSIEEQKPSEAPKPEHKPGAMDSDTFSGLQFRSLGPGVASGRVISLAVNPKNKSEFYVGVASGGVWKTVNSGTTWNPVFDGEGSYSIGWVTLDPNDPSVVWVGTGESNSQRSVGYGNGVYRSDDGGKSWKNMGLKKSEHIGRIAIDPRDTKVVYVAAEGPLWGPGGDRGLYRSADGGKTWETVLTVSENTGVVDVALDPTNPDIVYAAAYQRRRHVFTLIDGGPESAIYKSTDAGATWNKLKSGLPSVDTGRIGLAVSPADANVVYATIEAADGKGGVFRSLDKGATWERRNEFNSGAMYYGQIIADPKNVERVVVMSVQMRESLDGGKTLHTINEKYHHGDNHAIWIDPDNTKHCLLGSDGGVYESFDGFASWQFKANLPTVQFYDVAVDNATPFYNVYGGTQDYFSWGGPSRTKSAQGIVNSDWYTVTGGDGFHAAVDPEDPNTVYGESQYGVLVRYDRKTGEELLIQPQPGKGEPPLRWNWDSPVVVSPHSHTRLYFAANKLFRSDDRGDTWRAVSGDLSRQIDRNKLPVMGKVWGPDAVAKNQSTSFYGNIVALSESPAKEGLIYVGTDDGLVQVTEDGGATWTKYEKFPGVPDMSYVSRLAASRFDANTVYATFENHKYSDFKPYVTKSTDAGKTWNSITGDLPENGPTLAFAEDTVSPNLLFVGTEFGAFFTNDGGKKWIQMKGGLPTIAVKDIVIQKRENDLVLATFGRGFYVLDDIAALRKSSSETLQQNVATFPVKDALLYIERRPLGVPGKGFQGDAYYSAANPPFGAILTYYLKEKIKTLKEQRQAAEKEAVKKDGKGDGTDKDGKDKDGKDKVVTDDKGPYASLPYPSNDALRAEAEEQKPEVYFVIYDETGAAIRRVAGDVGEGFHRTAWDLRYATQALPAPSVDGEADEDFASSTTTGPLVFPGKYSARMFKKVNGQVSEIGGPQNFTVTVEGASAMSPQDFTTQREFMKRTARLYRALNGAINTANDLQSKMKTLRSALHEVPAAEDKLSPEADALEKQNNEILRALRGDVALAARNENVAPSINDRVTGIMEGERFSLAKPTQTHADDYAIASQEFTTQLAKLKILIQVDLAKLEREMEAAGAPWTPGRLVEWEEK
jgi:photosystem II stability/assembly factor-like uncharacterized protein